MDSGEPIKNELSYYEFWLTKKIWPATRAIRFMTDYHVLRRSWDKEEDYYTVFTSFEKELVNKMGHEDARHIFSKVVEILEGYDDDGVYVEHELDMNKCDVKPKEYLSWMYDKGYKMPYEFEAFIGIPEDHIPVTNKLENQIIKDVIQGIGRTLWDFYPKMKIEEMQDHKAIQMYGAGTQCADTTVRRYLSEVDPRKKNKTGPKKK